MLIARQKTLVEEQYLQGKHCWRLEMAKNQSSNDMEGGKWQYHENTVNKGDW
jgi:hypothetical protein